MNGTENNPSLLPTGFFLFSLDVELAWGYFDQDEVRSKLFSPDGSRERRAIKRLLDIFDEFEIAATWAITGHLFYERCEECEICPVLAWKGKYRSFEEIYKTDRPLWYGGDIMDYFLSRSTRHEIAFHGYSHRPFDEINEEEARVEIQEWRRIGKRKGLAAPVTVIFPKHGIDHLEVFPQAGFICYRGKEPTPASHNWGYLGRLIKGLDYTFALSTPPVFDLYGIEPNGLVNLPSSQHLFAYQRRLELVLDALNLHNFRLRRMVKGIRKAADEKKIVHYWAHPWAFRTDKDFEKLRYLLGFVAEEVSKGRMQSIGMADLARRSIATPLQQR
jgi:peptidoglycan/xylan/chitin deacetylase (PgdA/CDA1 family)